MPILTKFHRINPWVILTENCSKIHAAFWLATKRKTFKNLLVRNHWTYFNIILQKCSYGGPLPYYSSHCDSSKNMAARGRGLFSLYIYIENFKNLLVRNHRTYFNISWQICFFVDLQPRLSKPYWFVKKHGRKGRGLFSLYIYIENFKNLLVRNHWIDFNITWQECSFWNPLQRLFKPSWFVKKHGRRGCVGGGGGLIYPIYLYRKL